MVVRDSRETDEVLVCMAQRLQGQVERQLTLVERLHEASTDETLADLAELRTTLQRSLRGIENILVLSGAQQGPRSRGPRPVAEVLADARAGVDDSSRVELGAAPDVSAAPRAVSGLVALFTELLNHALTVAPGLSMVEVTSRRSEDGGVVVEVATDGPGPTPGELDELNRRLTDRPIIDDIVSDRVGLFVAARIAARSGVTVRVQHRRVSGHVAVVHCPPDVLDNVVDGPRTWDRGGFGNGYAPGGNGSPANGPANGRSAYGPNGSGANGYGSSLNGGGNGYGGYGGNGHAGGGSGNGGAGNGSAWTPPARDDDPLTGSRSDGAATTGGYASAGSPTGDFPLPDAPPSGTGSHDAVGGTGGYAAQGTGGYAAQGTGGYDAVQGTGGYGAVPGDAARDLGQGTGGYDAVQGTGGYDLRGTGGYDAVAGTGGHDVRGGDVRGDASGSGAFDARPPEAYDRNGLPVRRRPDPLLDPLPSASTPPSAEPRAYAPPTYSTPDYSTPTYGTPDYSTPDYAAPGYGAPGYGAPAYAPSGGPVRSADDEADVLFGPLSSSLRDRMRESGPSPIYEAVASAWFIEGPDTPGGDDGDGPPADWSTPSDAEWRAATERAARPAVEQYQSTAAGLPRRRPGTQMVAPPRHGPPAPAAGPREREPERVRERLAVYQQGLERGRHRATDGE